MVCPITEYWVMVDKQLVELSFQLFQEADDEDDGREILHDIFIVTGGNGYHCKPQGMSDMASLKMHYAGKPMVIITSDSAVPDPTRSHYAYAIQKVFPDVDMFCKNLLLLVQDIDELYRNDDNIRLAVTIDKRNDVMAHRLHCSKVDHYCPHYPNTLTRFAEKFVALAHSSSSQ